MRALAQRVSEARVRIAQHAVRSIGPSLLVLFCTIEDDTMQDAERLATKIAKPRIFEDDDSKMNRAVAITEGATLVVSQFTLAAESHKGNRPSFITAARPEITAPLTERFIGILRDLCLFVVTGEFGVRISEAGHRIVKIEAGRAKLRASARCQRYAPIATLPFALACTSAAVQRTRPGSVVKPDMYPSD